MHDEDEILWRIPEVAARTGIPEETLRYMRRLKKGPKSIKLAGRVVYKKAEVLDWIEAEFEKVG